MSLKWERLRSWEGLLLAILATVIVTNAVQSPFYLGVENQVNLFVLFVERIIVVLAMTFIIINGEIDLSAASVMGLSACMLAYLHGRGVPLPVGILAALLAGALAGAFNGFWIA
ncbi:MAG: ABC transporter permease subunit, partial [Anaerolineae bacterium]